MSTIMKHGKAVSVSRNLRGIVDYARKNGVASIATARDPKNETRGCLHIIFGDYAVCEDSFASYEVMIDWVRDRMRRNAGFKGASVTYTADDWGYMTAPGTIAGPLTDEQVKIVARHYIGAALWADCPEGTHPRASRAAVKAAQKAVREFARANSDDVRALLATDGYGDTCAQDFGGARRHEWPFASFGHDLYLSGQGHGAGFFDRGLGELGERLQRAASKYDARDKAWSVEPEFYRGWLYLH